MGLCREDELAVLRHAQPVRATVVGDDQFLARTEQYLARHFWRDWLSLGRLVHIETIIIITVVVNRSQILFPQMEQMVIC